MAKIIGKSIFLKSLAKLIVGSFANFIIKWQGRNS
jgi:hypothetical protein